MSQETGPNMLLPGPWNPFVNLLVRSNCASLFAIFLWVREETGPNRDYRTGQNILLPGPRNVFEIL